MKQQFPWMALLLMSGLFGSSFCGRTSGTEKCDSDGIVGSFSVDNQLNSLSITPANFTKDLIVNITKPIDDGTDQGIQLYLTLDDESSCKDLGNLILKFQIIGKNPGDKCEFIFEWDQEKGKGQALKIQTIMDVNDLDSALENMIASFEVRREGGEFNTVVTTASGEEIENKTANCIDINDTSIVFQLIVPKPAELDKKECGVQLEMKGEYKYTELQMDDIKCSIESGPSNGNGTETTIATTTADAQEDGSLPWWAIALIVVGAVLIILVAIFLIVYFVILPKRKAALDDEVEDAADAPEGEVGMPDELVKTAEEIQDD